MAWYPINRLMMVQSATLGYAERPEEVAERMAVVRACVHRRGARQAVSMNAFENAHAHLLSALRQ